LLFKRKSTVKVYMTALDSEKGKLADYLLSEYKLNSNITSEGLELNMDYVQAYSLVRMVTNFLHHKNLSNKFWVSADNNSVKVNEFKHGKKAKENKHPVTPSIMKHGF
jgi:hypothetical protein